MERITAESRKKNNKPPLRDMHAMADAIIYSIRSIEDQIRTPVQARGSDFSMEEIAMAEEIMAEQSKNPFEVEQ